MFRTLRERGPGHDFRAPTFDEEKGGPVPNHQLIEADTEAVVFGGIYMLADQGPWREIGKLVDEK